MTTPPPVRNAPAPATQGGGGSGAAGDAARPAGWHERGDGLSTFPCTQCGAELEFKPGSRGLTCPYCGGQNDIPEAAPVQEQDFTGTLAALADKQEGVDRITAHCDSCGATTELPQGVTASTCPFCGSHVVATGASQKLIKPHAVLPFAIDKTKAAGTFRTWLSSLWFAPGNLKKLAIMEGELGAVGGISSVLTGVYLPYWTYDAHATTPYTGQRGDAYYVSVPYTAFVNGKPVTQMRQERRVRWSWVQGTVENAFDDVLVAASHSLPIARIEKLGGWDLAGLVAYNDAFLSGFRAESYSVDLPSGFTIARGIMEGEIRDTIRGDIGGDEQRIASMAPAYRGIMFKHILLPVWISAYRYAGTTYHFLVNARTGQITGERPYSAPKITLFVLMILAIIGIIVAIASGGR